MSAPNETRWRVYEVLKDGKTGHMAAARLLKITRPTVEHHAAALVAEGVLQRRDSGPGKPAMYDRTTRSLPFEARHNLPNVGRAGRADAARVHRGEFKVRVMPFGAHVKTPPYEKQWEANGVHFGEWLHAMDGDLVRVRESRGSKNCRLTLQPAERYVAGPAEMRALRTEWAGLVEDAMRDLSALYGYQRAGIIEECSPKEYEWQAPALAVGARALAADGSVWTDASKGPANIETDSQTVAEHVAGLPGTVERVVDLEESMGRLLDQVQVFKATKVHNAPDLFAPIVEILEGHGETLARLLAVSE